MCSVGTRFEDNVGKVRKQDEDNDTKCDDNHTRENLDLSECNQRLCEPISRVSLVM